MINDFKPVAFFDVTAKIDAVGKDADEVGHDARGNFLTVHRNGKTAVNNTGSRVDLFDQFVFLQFGLVFAVLVFFDDDPFAGTDLRGKGIKRNQFVFGQVPQQTDLQFLSGLDVARIVNFFGGQIKLVGFLIFHSEVCQQIEQGVSRFDREGIFAGFFNRFRFGNLGFGDEIVVRFAEFFVINFVFNRLYRGGRCERRIDFGIVHNQNNAEQGNCESGAKGHPAPLVGNGCCNLFFDPVFMQNKKSFLCRRRNFPVRHCSIRVKKYQ